MANWARDVNRGLKLNSTSSTHHLPEIPSLVCVCDTGQDGMYLTLSNSCALAYLQLLERMLIVSLALWPRCLKKPWTSTWCTAQRFRKHRLCRRQHHPPPNVSGVPETVPSSAQVLTPPAPPQAPTPVLRDNFRDIQVKVHLRTPGKDSWSYQGRAVVQQEILGHSSRVGASYSTHSALRKRCTNDACFPRAVVRPLNGGKPLTVFSDVSPCSRLMPCGPD